MIKLTNKELLQQFLNRLDGLNKSQHTIDGYRTDLNFFFKYLKEKQLEVLNVDLQALEGYTVHLKYTTYGNDKRYSENTVTRRITSVRLFYNYLNKRGLIKENPALELELPKKLEGSEPSFMTQTEVKRLIQATEGETHEVRDALILKIFVTTGIRLSELVALDKDDVLDTLLVVRKGKGNKTRKVFLTDSLAREVYEYKKTDKSGNKSLFSSQKGNRIANSTVQLIVKKYMDKIGMDLEKFSTHSLRHTAASLMLDRGMNVIAIKQSLGHSSLETTQRYAHMTDTARQESANMMVDIY